MYPSIQIGFSFLITSNKKRTKINSFFLVRIILRNLSTLCVAIGVGERLWKSRSCLSIDKYFVVIIWEVLLAAIAFYHEEIDFLTTSTSIDCERMRALLSILHVDVLKVLLFYTHFLYEFHNRSFFLVSWLFHLAHLYARIPVDLFSTLNRNNNLEWMKKIQNKQHEYELLPSRRTSILLWLRIACQPQKEAVWFLFLNLIQRLLFHKRPV